MPKPFATTDGTEIMKCSFVAEYHCSLLPVDQFAADRIAYDVIHVNLPFHATSVWLTAATSRNTIFLRRSINLFFEFLLVLLKLTNLVVVD